MVLLWPCLGFASSALVFALELGFFLGDLFLFFFAGDGKEMGLFAWVGIGMAWVVIECSSVSSASVLFSGRGLLLLASVLISGIN